MYNMTSSMQILSFHFLFLFILNVRFYEQEFLQSPYLSTGPFHFFFVSHCQFSIKYIISDEYFFFLSVCPSSSAQVKRKAHYIIQYFVSLFFYYLFLFYVFCLFLPLYLSICFFSSFHFTF